MKNATWRVINRNQANAQHSTGPKTAEGKAVSSQNATKHGLSSKQIVIPGEDPAEYDTHRADLIAGLKPIGAIESELVEELAAHSWRQKRALRIETAILAEIAAGAPDPHVAIAKSFLERPKELERLIRYMTSIERAYWRVFNKLEAIQLVRRQQEQEQAMQQAYLESLREKAPRRIESAGFVLQSAENVPELPAAPALKVAAAGQSLSS